MHGRAVMRLGLLQRAPDTAPEPLTTRDLIRHGFIPSSDNRTALTF